MSRASGGLTKWFKEDWVDIGSKKKDGSFASCGRSSTKGSKRKYPKCVPRSKANSMTSAQIKSAVRRKRNKRQGVGGKPTNVRTFTQKGKQMPYGKGTYGKNVGRPSKELKKKLKKKMKKKKK